MSEFNIRLEQIRKKLLDLSKRNKLINYRRPHKSKNLKIIDESPEFIYKFLLNTEKKFKFKSIPYPTKMPEYLRLTEKKKDIENHQLKKLISDKKKIFFSNSWHQSIPMLNHSIFPFSSPVISQLQEYKEKKQHLENRLHQLTSKIEELENSQNFNIEAQAKELGLRTSNQMPEINLYHENNFDIHLDSYLQTLHYPDELERILKNIELNARSIMEITGSNMLYLVLGVLEWQEKDKPNVPIKSPLVTIPVALKRMEFNEESNTYEYTLSYTGDIIDSNESLSQKLFNDFKIKLPKLSEEVSFNNYIKEVQKLCLHQNNWKIKQEIALDFLQFGKVLMYKDLETTQQLQKHRILKDIFLGKSNNNSSYASSEYDIDKESLKKNMPLILDADSSQHSAMIDVLQGKNVVIEGPPGTGKSQIIANLIALLMNEGKKVLFVSEKLVALQVVHQRLEQIGLGDFCLELHSHKTDKVDFLKNLHKRVSRQYNPPLKYQELEQELNYSKQELSKYLNTLHYVYGANEKSIFETIWLREKYLEAEQYFLFKISNSKRLKVHDLLHCEEHLKEYQIHYIDYNLSEFFWVGFEVSELSFMESHQFIALLSKLKTPYLQLSQAFQEFEIKETNEPLVLKNLKTFLEEFKALEKPYFSFSELEAFKNLENKLQTYLQTLLRYIDTSEINNLLTSEILHAIETSSLLLNQLAEFEGELRPELIAFQHFIERAKKNYNEFENIEQRNSDKLYLAMVNHKSPEAIFEIVHTLQEKRDSWFRFLSPAYKKAKKSFASLLKEPLPKDSKAWTFLLRELNIYTLNRENQLNLRLMLIQKVPLFIEKTDTVYSAIKETLETYKKIDRSPIEEEFKKILFANPNAVNQFETILQNSNQIDQIYKALKPYGSIDKAFWGKTGIRFEKRTIKLQNLEHNKASLSAWINFQRLLHKLYALGLKEMMKSAERQEIPKDKLLETFYFNYYNSLLHEAFLEYPILEKFTRVKHDSMVKKFQDLDKEYIEKSRAYIAHNLSQSKLPSSEGKGRVTTFTNMKLLQHEMNKKRRHLPIRQLLKRAGEAIHVLKPCFMMSPLSVAQYMPINESSFDVLLIDEASQLKPEESLGVIARAKQVVVVGDPKQMPPTAFFDIAQEETSAQEKTVLDDSESILDSFMELYTPIRRLKWHYRSQHESLIHFSNKHFYDGELTIFPSPSTKENKHLGIRYTYVSEGIYTSGSQHRSNRIEAQKVLETIKEQMKNFPEKSLGIGTLNGTQQALIQELVDEAEKEYPYISSYIENWRNKNEAFFVKNLESLQGDERDVILISITYGKEEGKENVAQRFGPINQENGWRRLNVLITRAKQKMHVFTSMLSSDIKTTDGSSRGLKSLKDFLKFLEQKQSKETHQSEEQTFSSLFTQSLYQILKQKGYETVPNVGVSGYLIDLAVVSKKNGAYILAIECDGKEFYSANSSTDRYRLKTEALKRLGWNHYQLWSAEWHKNRELELQKLIDVINYCEHQKEKKETHSIQNLPIKEEPQNEIEQIKYSNFEQHNLELQGIKKPISNSSLAVILGMAKVHPEAKTREKAIVILKEHGGFIVEQALKICEKKRYLSMSKEKTLRVDFNKLNNIKGFDIDVFAHYIAWNHPLSLGNYHFIDKDNDAVERFILKRLNKEKVTLITAINPRFLKATNIRDLSITSISNSLWKMHWLQQLRFDYVGSHISVPTLLNQLTQLHTLTIYAKYIHIDCNFQQSIKTLAIQGCTELTFRENTLLSFVETLYLISVNDDFNINFKKLKKILPNLKQIRIGAYIQYNLKEHKNELLDTFSNVYFSYDR